MLQNAANQAGGSSKPKIAIVIDTSILIAAIFFGGKPEEVFRHLLTTHTVVLSDVIIAEFEAFARHATPKQSRATIRFMCAKLEKFVRPCTEEAVIDIRDINDSHVVQLARQYDAIIISSDKDLLEYGGDVIVLNIDEAKDSL